MAKIYNAKALEKKAVIDLRKIAESAGVEGFEELEKDKLIEAILAKQPAPAPVPKELNLKTLKPVKYRGKWLPIGTEKSFSIDIANDLIAAKAAVTV